MLRLGEGSSSNVVLFECHVMAVITIILKTIGRVIIADPWYENNVRHRKTVARGWMMPYVAKPSNPSPSLVVDTTDTTSA